MNYAIKINHSNIKQAEEFLESKGFTRHPKFPIGVLFNGAETIFTYEGNYYYSVCNVSQLMNAYDDLTEIVI